jgi:hypothetical protein
MKTLTEFSVVMLQRGAAARSAKTAVGIAAEAMTEAVATALAIPAERAQRDRGPDIVGGDLDKIRLVRVFQGEKGPDRRDVGRRVPLRPRPRGRRRRRQARPRRRSRPWRRSRRSRRRRRRRRAAAARW